MWVIAQASVGVGWAALASWLIDLLLLWGSAVARARVEGGGRGVVSVLGFIAVGLITVWVVGWSRPAGLAGGSVLVAALILGGFGSGTSLVDERLGFLFSRAHDPAMYVLLGTWIGALSWNLLPIFHADSDRRPTSGRVH
ncbi:MAG: hypothetical protein ACRDI0_00500 [Actinomycetota bacterium]